jgi:hypothetical protein
MPEPTQESYSPSLSMSENRVTTRSSKGDQMQGPRDFLDIKYGGLRLRAVGRLAIVAILILAVAVLVRAAVHQIW